MPRFTPGVSLDRRGAVEKGALAPPIRLAANAVAISVQMRAVAGLAPGPAPAPGVRRRNWGSGRLGEGPPTRSPRELRGRGPGR